MKQAFDYIFIFLIGYQAYFLISLLTVSGANQELSLAVSLLALLLCLFVWLQRNTRFSPTHVTMAVTTGVLSLSSIAVYAYLLAVHVI
ncbi:hypothetical protein [Salipaludibacillus aurantiacus]|uniref:Uncharacterized protein n=1 Tax=Salipaludibacillus aurantiacus TaxID=1601833 RepID=A0A1H9TS64_9BACI|nr:hypothetical protein [Salipaludibacillus aurantiacus]SER99811.1 hypothetical protein SAMN05518684_10642 [Salipaludibacillus aurantiacus]